MYAFTPPIPLPLCLPSSTNSIPSHANRRRQSPRVHKTSLNIRNSSLPPPPPPPPPSSSSSSSTAKLSVLTSRTSLITNLVPYVQASWNLAWKILMSQLAPTDANGAYVRPTSTTSDLSNHRNIEPTDRLNLYVGIACPWCHRITLALTLLKAASRYNLVVVEAGNNGLWEIKDGSNSLLKDIYLNANANYQGRFTAPLLYNESKNQIICNESSTLLEYLHDLYQPFSSSERQPKTQDEKEKEKKLCQMIYNHINNGVYKIGFSTSQSAYDQAESDLFYALDELEQILSSSNFLLHHSTVSIADMYLFPTVYRFDSVYAPFFQIHRKSIRFQYPAIAKWLRRMYHIEGVAQTCAPLQDISEQYYGKLFPLNPSAIIPKVADIDLSPLSPDES